MYMNGERICMYVHMYITFCTRVWEQSLINLYTYICTYTHTQIERQTFCKSTTPLYYNNKKAILKQNVNIQK